MAVELTVLQFFVFYLILVAGIIIISGLVYETIKYCQRHREHKHKYNYAGEYVDGDVYGEEYSCGCGESKMIYYDSDQSVLLEVYHGKEGEVYYA